MANQPGFAQQLAAAKTARRRPVHGGRFVPARSRSVHPGRGHLLPSTAPTMAAACSIGDLVHVRWGTGKGVSFEAVVHEQSEKGIRVCIDGPDERHPLSGCAIWLEADRIRPLPAPSKLPEWASEGCRVRALNPTADDESWDEATILVSRQGVKRGEAGVRFQVKFAGGTTAWVRFGDIAQPSTQVAPSAPPLSLPPPMVSATETDEALANAL